MISSTTSSSGSKSPRSMYCLAFDAELGAFGDVRAQDVAGRDERQAEVLDKACGLGALAGARRADEDEVELGGIDAAEPSSRKPS